MGFTLVTLAVGSFVLRVLTKVFTGHGADTYKNIYALTFTYWGAFVVLVCGAIVGAIGVGYYVRRLVIERRTNRTR